MRVTWGFCPDMRLNQLRLLSEQRLLDERIRLERFNTSIGVLGAVLLSAVLYLLYPAASTCFKYVTLWFWLQVLVAAAWLVFAVFYDSRQVRVRRWWPWLSTLTSSFFGLVWGIGWVWLLPEDALAAAGFSALLITLLAGGVYATVFHLPSLFSFVLCCLLPAALGALVAEGNAFRLWFGAVAGVSIFAALAFGVTLHRFLLGALEQREQNRLLALQLETEKREAEQASHEKTRFLAAASHDLRQPIQALQLFEHLLDEQVKDPSQRALLEKIHAATDSIAGLLDVLLDISRLDAGLVRANCEAVLLDDVLAPLAEQYRELAAAQSVALHYVSSRVCVYSDPQLLERMVRNLLQNAITHMGRPGKILLGVRRTNGQACIQVWDNGCGIPPAEQEKIFHEFYQLGNPERNRRKGLGLGLSIVRRLGSLLGHPLRVGSTPGRGSVFMIMAGRCVAAEKAPVTPAITFRQPNLGGLQVLVIEDDVNVQTALAELLRRWGADVLTACYKEEAMGCGDAVALVISDYQLQADGNGIDAILAIRKRHAANVPAILLTGNTNPEVLRQLARHDIVLLSKPLTPKELAQALSGLLPDVPGHD